MKIINQKKLIIISRSFFFLFLLNIQVVFGQKVFLNDYEKKIKNNYSLKNAIDKIGHRDIEKNLRDFISKSRPNRVTGSIGSQGAQEFLYQFLNSNKDSNTTVTKEEFKTLEGHSGTNLIWRKKGSLREKSRVIVLAHYDTILKNNSQKLTEGEMPGADNNASSVSILLAMVSLFNQLEIPKTVEIVFVDAHEWNDQGTKHYLSKNSFSDKDDFFINLSKLGHDSKKDDKLGKYNNFKVYTHPQTPQQDLALDFIKRAQMNYPQINLALHELQNGTKSESIDLIWAQRLPGILISQDQENDLNPRLYSNNDFAETLNFNSLFFVYKAITSSVLSKNYDIVK